MWDTAGRQLSTAAVAYFAQLGLLLTLSSSWGEFPEVTVLRILSVGVPGLVYRWRQSDIPSRHVSDFTGPFSAENPSFISPSHPGQVFRQITSPGQKKTVKKKRKTQVNMFFFID